MGHVHRFVRLTEKQDAELRALERDEGASAKERLRASVVRLSNRGMSLAQLSVHFDRSEQSIRSDLRRYEQHGLAGLRDAKSPGGPPLLCDDMRAFIDELLQEDRVWNCSLLQEALADRFGVWVERETMRTAVTRLGYSWKRTKYVPTKQQDPEIVHEHRASIETLKKGRAKAG